MNTDFLKYKYYTLEVWGYMQGECGIQRMEIVKETNYFDVHLWAYQLDMELIKKLPWKAPQTLRMQVFRNEIRNGKTLRTPYIPSEKEIIVHPKRGNIGEFDIYLS